AGFVLEHADVALQGVNVVLDSDVEHVAFRAVVAGEGLTVRLAASQLHREGGLAALGLAGDRNELPVHQEIVDGVSLRPVLASPHIALSDQLTFLPSPTFLGTDPFLAHAATRRFGRANGRRNARSTRSARASELHRTSMGSVASVVLGWSRS